MAIVSLLMSGLSLAAEPACSKAEVSVAVAVENNKVIRQTVPLTLFGFSMPWHSFQVGLTKDGKVKPEVVEYLQPFAGALYRYPGGTPSNWFDWNMAMKASAQRTPILFDFNMYVTPQFGLPEFTQFLTQVNGRAILTMNMVGPYLKPQSANVISQNVLDIANYLKAGPLHCVSGKDCPIAYWELGNELDWKPIYWSAKQYLAQSNTVVQNVSKVYPDLDWVANGKTAPWENKLSMSNEFDTALAQGQVSQVKKVAFHPYYDGMSIPKSLDYLAELKKVWSARGADGKVLITEHARWPSQPLIGKWEDRWYEGNSLGGALSSADFMLAIIPDPMVEASNWHALGVEGPWQLFRWNRQQNTVYPNPVYWGLRTLREALLDKVVQTAYEGKVDGSYAGGYDLRLVAMRSADQSQRSLLGVNRSGKPLKLVLNWQDGKSATDSQWRVVTSKGEEDDNTDATPRKVTMQKTGLDKKDAGFVCVPPKSVFSVVQKVAG